MKVLYHLIIIGIFGFQSVSGQHEPPFYEQIAFDYYRTEIHPKNPNGKRIRVYKEIDTISIKSDFAWYPRCFKNFRLSENDTFKDHESGKDILDFPDLNTKYFKEKKYGKGSYPKLFVSRSLTINQNIVIVNVREIHKWHGTYYHIKMDLKGNVLEWCRGGYIV